jgi:hypothetical protein
MPKSGAILILAALLTAQVPISKGQAQTAPPSAAIQSDKIQTTPERADRTQNEERALFYTGAGAIFTGLLFLTGAIQAWLFVWQLGKISEQGKLARDEFNATHRPKLRVRLLKVKPLEIGKPVEIEYALANIGQNDAVKIHSEITLKVVAGHLGKEDSWTKEFQISDIATGGCVTPTQVTDAVVSPDWDDVLKNPNGKVRIQGIINYEEKSGIRRKTGFFRECTDGLNRFSRFGTEDIQSDYEYED